MCCASSPLISNVAQETDFKLQSHVFNHEAMIVMLIARECTNTADLILSKVISNIFSLLCSLVDEIFVSCKPGKLFQTCSKLGTLRYLILSTYKQTIFQVCNFYEKFHPPSYT